MCGSTTLDANSFTFSIPTFACRVHAFERLVYVLVMMDTKVLHVNVLLVLVHLYHVLVMVSVVVSNNWPMIITAIPTNYGTNHPRWDVNVMQDFMDQIVPCENVKMVSILCTSMIHLL